MLEGDIFPQRVQLGGALFASEDSAADSAQTKKNQAQAMKVSAAASFSSSWAQASASASHEQGNSSIQNTSKQNLTNAMAWEATGGDTLRCNNPPQWCATVGDFYNWRVINQSDVLQLYEALDEINGNTNFATQFEQAAKRG
ncbi:hypothetical protein APSETT444_001604 [Aspergillus pseudonomiae]